MVNTSFVILVLDYSFYRSCASFEFGLFSLFPLFFHVSTIHLLLYSIVLWRSQFTSALLFIPLVCVYLCLLIVFFPRLTSLSFFFFQPFQVSFSDSDPDSDEINARRQLMCDEYLPSSSSSDPPFTSSGSDDEVSSGLQFQLIPSSGGTWQRFRGRLQGQPASRDP